MILSVDLRPGRDQLVNIAYYMPISHQLGFQAEPEGAGHHENQGFVSGIK